MSKFFLTCLTILFIGKISYAQDIGAPQQNSTQLEAQLLQQMIGATANPTAPTPNVPALPSPPAIDNLQQKKAEPIIKEPKKKEPLFPFNGYVVLQDGRIFEGIFLLPKLVLSVRQSDKDYYFFKTLNIEDIQSISIKEWETKKAVNSQQTEETLFEAKVYTIQTFKGETLTYTKNILALNRISFSNSLGETAFFTYFVDYQKNNRWVNLKTSSKVTVVKHGLSDVVVKINIGSLPKVKKKSPKTKKKARKKEEEKVLLLSR